MVGNVRRHQLVEVGDETRDTEALGLEVFLLPRAPVREPLALPRVRRGQSGRGIRILVPCPIEYRHDAVHRNALQLIFVRDKALLELGTVEVHLGEDEDGALPQARAPLRRLPHHVKAHVRPHRRGFRIHDEEDERRFVKQNAVGEVPRTPRRLLRHGHDAWEIHEVQARHVARADLNLKLRIVHDIVARDCAGMRPCHLLLDKSVNGGTAHGVLGGGLVHVRAGHGYLSICHELLRASAVLNAPCPYGDGIGAPRVLEPHADGHACAETRAPRKGAAHGYAFKRGAFPRALRPYDDDAREAQVKVVEMAHKLAQLPIQAGQELVPEATTQARLALGQEGQIVPRTEGIVVELIEGAPHKVACLLAQISVCQGRALRVAAREHHVAGRYEHLANVVILGECFAKGNAEHIVQGNVVVLKPRTPGLSVVRTGR
mmetsp:Transcript_6504/g.19276  ORF Transcript_6504/g.19276 Transcript_6504/m.19276 type:complete len:432 (+) Transcript_6504:1145-2440(+)